MAILKRINKYQGLKDIDILVEETGLTSQYFQVYDFPEQIPQGKSSFLVAGSPFLADNVELKIEILDAGGNTVYTEAITDYLEGQARRVSIEVYDDVVPGDGFMYIVGELKPNYKQISGLDANQDEITDNQIIDPTSFGPNLSADNIPEEFIQQINAQNAQDVPEEFQGVYNVRYVRPIFINAALPNSQPIFFYQQPRVTVTEVVKPFIEQLAPSGSVVLSGSIEANPAPDLPPLPAPIDPPAGFPLNPAAEGLGKIGQINEIFKSSKKAKANPFRNSGFRSRGRLVRRASPEQDRFSMKVHALEESNETTKDKASSALVGATLKIKSPKIDLVKFPVDDFIIPDVFETSVKKVLNEETIVPVDDFLITRKDTGEKVPVPIIADDVGGGGQSEVTMSYQPFPQQSLSATHNRSFADITVANLRTFSGDVYKTKIYGKSQGSLGDFELLHEGTIESPQTLIDPYSVDGFLNIGYFHTQSIVDNYWLLSGGAATRDDSKILDGVQISGSNYGVANSVEFTTSGSFSLEKGVPYSITFNAYYYKEDKVQDNGDVSKDFDLDVLVDEAALIGGSLSGTYQSVGKVDLAGLTETEGSIPGIYTTFLTPSDIGPTLKLKFKLNSGRAIINDVVVRPHAETNFNPDFFRVVLPMAYPLPKKPDLYDFLVEFYDVNNNIAETFTIRQNVEFTGAPLNIDGEDNLLSGSMFIGSAQGEGMELAGVSSAFLRSIGYQGFQNTIDNNKGGFLIFSGSIGGRLTASEAYDGVGLEIVDAHGAMDRYLKFRTNPSTFEVVTDQFFLGNESLSFISGSNGNIQIFSSGNTTLSGSEVDILTPNFYLGGDSNFISGSGGNIEIFNSGTTTLSGSAVDILTPSFFLGGQNAFVSGSGGNVEISSSNFHLTAGGDVTMSGDITANAGFIGDFAIIDGKISGSNITMDANNSTIFKTDQGPGSDTGESFAQLKNEYYIDFTPETENPDNFHVKFGPNFSVDKDGVLFASGARFEGSITASQGLIGGFTTDSSSFHSAHIFISGSPAVGGAPNDRHMFISSSNFNVKEDGSITGSSARFDGNTDISGTTTIGGNLTVNGTGTIASFGLTQTAISSSNDNLILKSTGEITASAAKISGDSVDIDVSQFELDATDVAISSQHASMSLGHDAEIGGGIRLVGTNGGTIAMGDTLPENLTSDGIFMSGSGDFNLQGNSANFIRRVGTALTIKAGTFDLDATTLILDSSGDSGNGVIRLGGSGGPSSPTSTTAGIYMDGGGALNVVGNSTNFLRTDAGSLTINTDTLDLKTATLRVSSSNGGVIALGETIPQKLEAAGLFLSGSGQFSLFSDSTNHLVFDGTTFKLASENLTIDTSTLDINTAGGGNIALGTGSPSLSAAGIFLSGSGDFNFMKDANNFIRQSGGTFQIKADTFDLATSTLIIDSATNNGKIALGASPNTGISGTNKGIYMDGTGDFLVYGSATNFFKFDGGGSSIEIKSDTFDLATSTLILDSGTNSGKLALGSTPPTAHNSGTGIYLDGTGKALIGNASGDRIQFDGSDFTVQVGSLELDATNIEISSQHASMSLGEGNINLDGTNAMIHLGVSGSNKTIKLAGTNSQGYIASGKTSATDNTAGFWLANNNTDPEFVVGNATDKISFNDGNLDISSKNLEVSASTLQLSTSNVSMSLGHTNDDPFGKLIMKGGGTPTFAMGRGAVSMSLHSGSGIFFDGDGNFRMGDANGSLSMNNGNFMITGSSVDINVEDIQITSSGFELSSTAASMSLGTNKQWQAVGSDANPFMSIGQSSASYGESGIFLGYNSAVSRPRVSFSGSAGHFKVDTGVDIKTRTFELDTDSNKIQVSSEHASMSLNDGNIKLQGLDGRIYVGVSGSGKELKLQGGSTDSFLAIGSKEPGFSAEGSGTSGILIGMDSTNPQAEFVKSATDYFIFDDGVDMKSTKLELNAGNGAVQISTTEASMSLGGSTGNKGAIIMDGGEKAIILNSGSTSITMQTNNTDSYMVMGSKTSFTEEGSGTAGILIGMDGSNPQAEFVKSATDYLIFDDGLDIKTTAFELSANSGNLQISSGDRAIRLSSGSSGQVTIQGDGTDGFISMGSKTSFAQEGSGTAGIIVGMDGSNPQAEFVKNSTNYLIFDDGIDIKTDTFKLDTARLDIDSSTSRVQVFDGEGDEVVRLGEISDSASDLYGLKIYDGSGTASSNTLVKLGGEGNTIAGWTISNDALTGGAMIIRQDGTIESSGFASDVAGSGFRLTAAQGGFLEVENAKIRGTLATAVFEKETVNAVGGQLYIANSTTLTSSIDAPAGLHTAAQQTMSVANSTGFEVGEILSLKKVSSTGFATEYVKVFSSSRFYPDSETDFAGNLFVTRSYGQGVSGDSGSLGEMPALSQSYSGSQVIVSTGRYISGDAPNTVGSGYIRMNANPSDPTTPYMDIVERTGSGIYDVELKARLGDLSGLSSGLLHGETSPGFGLFTENVFLQGAIVATTGSITGQLFVNTSDSERLILGVDIAGSNDGLHINNNNYWYTTGALKVGSANYYLQNDSSGNISIVPKALSVKVGSTAFELSADEDNSHQSMSFNDKDLLLQTISGGASITVGGTTSKQITIKGTSTAGSIASGKSNAGDTTAGFWLANNNTDPEFHVGNSSNFLKFDGGVLSQSIQEYELDAGEGDLQISSTHKSMSLADGAVRFGQKSSGVGFGNFGSTPSKAIQITGSSTQGVIRSGKSSATDLTEGFWLANNNTDAEFHIGDSNSALNFNDNNLSITSSKFELNAGDGDLQLSSQHASMSLGDGAFEAVGDQSNNLSTLRVGQHTIQNIQLTGSANAGIMKSGKKGINDLTAGFYMSNEAGTAKFHVGDGSSAFKFDGSNLHITASQANLSGNGVAIDVGNFELDATDIEISSANNRINIGFDSVSGKGIRLQGGATQTIGFGTVSSERMKLVSDTNDSFLQIGSPTFADPAQEGILIGSDGGNAELHLYKDASNYFKYDAGATPAFDLKTTSLEIATEGLSISGRSTIAASNKISLGTITSDSDTTGAGVFMDGGGHFRVFGNANNFMIVDGGSLQIKSDNVDITSTAFNLNANAGDLIISSSDHRISLANENIILDGTSTGFMSIGTVTGVTDTGGSNKGFYAEGDGDFITKAAANKYIQFNGGDLDIKTGIFKLDTAKLDIDSSAGGSGSIALGATPPTQYNDGTGFFVDGAGKFLLGDSDNNKVQFDGTTLTVAGTINIISGDLAGVDASTISGSGNETSASLALETAGLLEGSSSMQTQVVLNSDGMALKTAGGTTLANYGSTITLGRTDHAHSTFTSTTITQRDGDNKKVMEAASGVISLFGNDVEKAVFSSTGSLFRGDAANTFTRVDSSGLTIVDNGVTQGTFSNGTINLFGNNGTDRKVTIDSDGMKAFYDSNNFTFVSSSGFTIVGGGARKVSINSSRIQMGEDGEGRVEITDTDISMFDGQGTPRKRVAIDSKGTLAIGGGASADVSTTSTDNVVRVHSGGVGIFKDSNNYASMSSDGMELYQGGNSVSSFGSSVRIGKSGQSRVEISDTAFSMYDGQATPRKRVAIDSSGVIAIGGAGGADVATNSTDDVIRMTPSSGVTIFESSNNFATLGSSGLAITQGGNSVADFGDTMRVGQYGNHSRMEVSASEMNMYVYNADEGNTHKKLFIGPNSSDELVMAIGGANDEDVSATTNNNVLRITNDDVRIFNNSNDFVRIHSSGFDVHSGNSSNPSAKFGSEVELFPNGGTARSLHITANGINIGPSATGPGSANTPSAVAGNVSLHGQGARIYGAATDDYLDVKSDGIDLVTAGTTIAQFAAVTKIGDTSNEHVSIDTKGMNVMDGTTMKATFGTNMHLNAGDVFVGATGSEHVKISSTGVELKDNTTVYGVFASTTTIGDTNNEHISIDSDSVDIIQDSNNKAVVTSAGLTVTQGGNAVGVFGATMRVGEDSTTKSSLRIDGGANLSLGTSTEVAAHESPLIVSASGAIIAEDLRVSNTALLPSITQGFINPYGGSTSAGTHDNQLHNAGNLYYAELLGSDGNAMNGSNTRRLLDIAGPDSYISPSFARGANFVRFGGGSEWDNKVINYVHFKKTTPAPVRDHYRVAQIMLEGAEGEPFIADGTDLSSNVFYLKRVTSFTVGSTPSVNTQLRAFAPEGSSIADPGEGVTFSTLNNYHINVDDDDFWKSAFRESQTVGSEAGTYDGFTLTSGNRIFMMSNGLDWKIVSANSYDVMKPMFKGGLNVGSATSEYQSTYELHVGGDIGATGNITAYADYVCNSCGWHSAREVKVCPSCGSKDVHYHDDVQLLKQIIDVSAAYPNDTEKQYQAYQKLAHLGVIDVHMPGTHDKTGLREKDLKITHNLHAMNNYLISGLVQERKRSEGLEERIDKMETIIEAFGHEPYKGKPHNNDGILSENSTPGYGYNRKNRAFAGDYDKEKDLRVLKYKDSKGIKIFGASAEGEHATGGGMDGPLTKVKEMVTKKFHKWGMFNKKDKK